MRRGWIARHGQISLRRQCELAGVARATIYAQRKAVKPNAEDVELMNAIDALYTETPYFGSRRMTVCLRNLGFLVNRKRVQRLMRQMGLAGMGARATYQHATPRAQGLSLPAAGLSD